MESDNKPKFYVIGAGKTIPLESIRSICKIPEDAEIIVVESRDDIPLSEIIKSVNVPIFEYSMIQRVKEPFYPKEKHLPKGHERQYKYHR